MSGVLHGVVASLKAAAAAATDAFFEYVTLLLNTSATNGAQNNTFLDSSTNNFSITRNGDTTQGSFNPYMPSGYWSGYFDGTGDYLTLGGQSEFAFGTGDFTVEFWYYLNDTGTQQIVYDSRPNGVNGAYLTVYKTSANVFAVYVSSANTITGSVIIAANTWYHIAVSRSGTSTKLFVNGTQDGSTYTDSTNYLNGTSRPTIGADGAAIGGSAINAYLSNLRVVKGTAVYTANFTPSTTPLTAITNTSLLCLQDNRFKDNSTNAFAITRNGDTRSSKFAPFNPPASYSTASYGGSGYFDGTGDYLALPSSTNLTMNADFTWEFWLYPNSVTGSAHILADGAPNMTIQFDSTNGNQIIVFDGATRLIGAVATNVWTHFALVRSGTTVQAYFNGTAAGSSWTNSSTTIFNLSSGFVAARGTPSNYYTGYISNLRVVKGTAVYTANFTPPTTPLTAITNTSLLLNFTNAGIFDAATINDGQTVGNAQVSTTQAKWSPTSMAFDGTGDYVTVIDKPELRLGTGDFTIEGWVYLNATGVAYGLVSKGTATTGWSVNVTSGNKLQFSYTATQLTGATSLASGTWYYFAVVRSGTASGNLRVILNGSTDATSAGAVNDNFNQTNVLYVGADRVAGAVLNGYLQDVRITNGYARTTSTPTAAFPTL
jgi:hypothetical protein